jgi:hypothetical protein
VSFDHGRYLLRGGYVIACLFCNCYANYGSTNARELASMLTAELEAEIAAAPTHQPDVGA